MHLRARIDHSFRQRHLIKELVYRDIRGRYVGSSMGVFWSVINPLIMLVIYTYIFSGILKVKLGGEPGVTNFALYLFCGFVAWNAFQETVQRSATIVVDNALLIKNLSFPSKALPLTVGITSTFHELIGIGILFIAVGVVLGFFPTYFFLLIPLICFQLLFGLGLGFIFSTLHVFFRDIAQLLGVLLVIWMFGTPLFYPESMVPANLKFLIWVNPMAYLIRMFREICLKNVPPSPGDLVIFAAISVAIFLVGYSVYTKRFYQFIDEL